MYTSGLQWLFFSKYNSWLTKKVCTAYFVQMEVNNVCKI